jgi:ribosomal protein S18 acetylase RimI-like enzyme
VIRQASPEDAAAIAALSIEVWLSTYVKQGITPAFANYVLSHFTIDKTLVLLNDPKRVSFVSQNSDGIDGVLHLGLDRAAPDALQATVEIETLYVQPRHHGRGIGQALLRAAQAHAQRPIWLTTNAKNSPAIGFYLAQGFAHAGCTDFVLGDRAYPNNIYLWTPADN